MTGEERVEEDPPLEEELFTRLPEAEVGDACCCCCRGGMIGDEVELLCRVSLLNVSLLPRLNRLFRMRSRGDWDRVEDDV